MSGCLVIVERELLALMRSRRTLWIFVAISIVFAGIVYLKWPSSGIVDLNGNKGRELFQWLSYSMLAASILIVPIFPATSLVSEVRRRTLELLLNSPLTRSSIYFGKAFAMLGLVILILFATLPAISCGFLMGGLSFSKDVLAMYGYLTLVSMELVVIGLLVGTWARSTESALRWSYGVTFALTIVPWFPDALFPGGASPISKGMQLLKLISPIPGMMEMLNQSGVAGAGFMDQRSAVAWYVMFAILFIVVGSIVCIQRLSHSLLDRSRSQGLITDDQSQFIRASRRICFSLTHRSGQKGFPGWSTR